MKNFIQIKAKIETLIEPILKNYHLKIYEINALNEFNQTTLQILIEDETDPKKSFDLDFLVKVNEAVSAKIDEIEAIMPTNYLLEVASAGIEKTIRSVEELQQAMGEYVFVELKTQVNKIQEFNGIVETYDAEKETFGFSYFLKGQPKKIELLFNEIKMIRYAIKF